MQRIYYFYILPSCKNLFEANDGYNNPTLQAEGYSSFHVQVEDGTHVSYM